MQKNQNIIFKLYNIMHELRIYESILKYSNSKGLNLFIISIPRWFKN